MKKKVCKIKFYPTDKQIKLINGTLGCCRFVKNKYIEFNNIEYEWEGKFLGANDFSRILNKLKHHDPDYHWIKNYSTKAIKDAICDEEKAYKRFFKGISGKPKFKARKRFKKRIFLLY